MKNLQRIAKKKNPTGEELGRLKVGNAAHTYKQKLEGHTPKHIISPEELREKIQQLSPDQREIYEGYDSLGEFIDVYYNVGLSYYQQSQNSYSDLMSYITEAVLVEDMHAHIAKLPAIMTQVQFEEEKKKGLYKWMHEEDGTLKMWSAADVFKYAYSYFLVKFEENPRRKNPLKPVKKEYTSMPTVSKIVLERYNAATGNGYKTLPDGRRSDQMTKAQWKKATMSPKMKKLTGQTPGMSTEEWKDFNALIKGLDLIRARELWENDTLPGSELEKKTLENAGYLVKQDFHVYETPPENLSKWEAVRDVFALARMYPAALGDTADTEAFKKEILDFTSEFSELVSAVVTAIDAAGWFTEKLAGIDKEEWDKPFISLQALYDLDYYELKTTTDSDKDVLFPDNDRARLNGVAVVQDFKRGFFEQPTDSRGYYIPPRITHQIDDPYSLEDFYPSEENEETINNIRASQKALEDSYYYIKGFNELLQMISKRFNIPGLDIYRLDLEDVEDRIQGLNEMTMKLYHQVYNTDYGETGDFQRYMKLDALKQTFGEIKYKNINVPVKNKTVTEQLFDNMKIFDLPELLEDLMLYRTLRPDSPLQGVL